MSRKEWTKPELRRAAEMFAAGAKWADVGERFGVTGNAVRRTLHAHGMKPERSRERPPVLEDLVLRAIVHRNRTGESWSLTRDAVGYPSSPESLRQAVRRYTERYGGRVMQGSPAVRRTKHGVISRRDND